MEIIDLRETRDQGLLEQVYNQLYLACFTDPNEQEELEQYRERLFDNQKPSPQPKTHFLVLGERLADPATRVIHGMMICEFYRQSCCGLLTYLAVVPGSRRKGYGGQLVSRAIEIMADDCAETGGLRAVFAETHDPSLVDAAREVISPRVRIEVLQKIGAHRVPIRYVQPSLRPGTEPLRNLILLAFKPDPSQTADVAAADLIAFLDEFYRALGIARPAKNADFLASKTDALDATKGRFRPEIVSQKLDLGLPFVSVLGKGKQKSGPFSWQLLLVLWLLVPLWFWGFNQLFRHVAETVDQALIAAGIQKSDLQWHGVWTTSRWFYLHAVLTPLVQLLVRVVQGTGLFSLFLMTYRTPFLLLVRSTFPDDEPLRPQWSWAILRRPIATILRLVEIIFYYANVLSLPAVRRFIYVATHPFFSLRFWNVSPLRIYKKLQLYFEVELFNPRITEGPEAQTRREYGDFIANENVKQLRKLDKGEIPVSQCRTCFDIFSDNQRKIEKYFQAQVDLGRTPRFLSRIEFGSGYLAPTYLVSGPLSEYDEDWTKIVDDYPEKMRRLQDKSDPLTALPDLRKLQSFIWDCWVQWGPSVPITSSDSWRQREVALQFGYGDENNSLPLRLKREFRGDEAGETHWSGCRFEDWQQWLTTLAKPEGSGWAWPVKVKGNLRWVLRSERNRRFCRAQHDTAGAAGGESDGWMVFDADSITGDVDGPMYYSAYVWVLIAICKSSNAQLATSPANSTAQGLKSDRGYELLEADSVNEWRCLIPFFQHGNIAEGSVYEIIKKELACKTIESLLNELEKAQAAGVDWLHFAFVAAYDDNGDAGYSTPVAQRTGRSIWQMLEAALLERVAREPAATKAELAARATRIHLAPNALDELTACRLPHVVRTYLDQL